MSPGTRRIRLLFTPLLVALSALAACQNDPVDPDDPAEDVATIRLNIGAEVVNISGSGGGIVTIPIGVTTVSATFLDDDGATLTIPTDLFEIRLESQNTVRVTFTRTGPFAGTLTGISAGTAVVAMSLYHTLEGHADFGPQSLTVTVE